MVTRTRAQEEAGERRNCNEGDLQYELKYEQSRLVLQIMMPQWIPTDEMDLDLQPTYVSLVAQGKVLRLRLPHAILPDESKAQRSQATGRLEVVMPVENEIVLPPNEPQVFPNTAKAAKSSLMADMLQDATDPGSVGIERIRIGDPVGHMESDSDEEPPPLF